MAAGGAFYTLNDAAMKFALSEISYGRAILVRGVACCALLFLAGFLRSGTKLFRWTNLFGQLECGLYYILASFLFIYSLPFLSFPIAVTALYTSPLFIVLLAPWFLNERLNGARITAALIGFLGVALAAYRENSQFSWIVLFPIGSALATAMRDITLRKLISSDSSFSILFFQQCSLALFGLFFAALEPTVVRPTDFTYGAVVIASLGLLLGVYCTIEAFRVSDVSAVSALRYTSIIWAAIVGAIFWNDRFSATQIVGMLLVIGSGTVVALAERRPKISTV